MSKEVQSTMGLLIAYLPAGGEIPRFNRWKQAEPPAGDILSSKAEGKPITIPS